MRRKRINKKKLVIALIILLLLLLGLTIGIYYLINKKEKPSQHLIYDEFEMIGGKLDNDTYYLLGASNDIAFEVITENSFSYEVKDSDGNKVNSQVTESNTMGGIKIKAPGSLYEEGKTYYLKINNGNFKDKKYKDFKEIIFKVTRPAKQGMTFKENAIKVDIKDVEINDNAIKGTDEYNENDIIVVYDNNKLLSAYKIDKVIEKGNYQYTIPKINEVFSDIDYYGKEKINLSDFQNDKNFNLFLNSLIHTVYAKEDVTISKPVWNKKDGTLEVGITVYTSNKKEFLANHDTKIELVLVLSIDLYKDITIDEFDYALDVSYEIKVKNNLNHSNNDFNKLYDAIKFKDNIENYDTTWLENNYDDITNDKKTINKSLGNIAINTEMPGLYLNVDLGVLMDLSSKGFINTSLTGKNSMLIGINSKKGIYSDYTFDDKSDLNFVGNENNKIGGIINTKLYFINLFKINTQINSGLYTDGKVEMKINKDDEKQTKIDYNISGNSGFFAKYLVDATDVKERTIYDDKTLLAKYEKKITISSKLKEEKKEEKPTYKYSKEKVKELLQSGYDILDQDEEWNLVMGTLTTHLICEKKIDVDNNTFTGTWTYDGSVSYTCTYNYVTGSMVCNNFEEAQNYVKSTCDNVHNDYLKYLESGEIENEEAKEWDNLYSDIDACYYETITSSQPNDFSEDMQTILDQVELTSEDLEVLKD